MKAIVGLFGLFGVSGLIVLAVVVAGLTVYGAVLAFKASIILGILALFVEPTPIVLGVLAVCGRPGVAEQIAKWLGLTV